MYQVIESKQQNILLDDREIVHEIYYIRDNEICIRQTRTLSAYRYQKVTNNWIQQWKHTVFHVPGDDNAYSLKHYPWLITDRLMVDKKKLIILKHPDGVQLLQLDENGLILLKEDTNFPDFYNFKYLFGYFYDDINSIGVMTSNRGKIEFYGIIHDSFVPDVNDPLFPFKIPDNSLSTIWHSNTTEFYTMQLQNQHAIVLKTNDGYLEFYHFNSENQLNNILKTQIKALSKSKQLYFVNLTNQIYQDIVCLTEDGLEIFQYDQNQKDYLSIHRYIDFTLYTNSIHFMDVNNDKRDDLIFSGVDGLTVLTFNHIDRNWDALIVPEMLSNAQRYGNIIKIINPSARNDPIIFIQNIDGTLQWARITLITKPVTESIEHRTTPVTNITINEKFTGLPIEIRHILRAKPILRVTEYLDDEFIKHAVDMVNGDIDFSIPMINIPELTGIPLKLDLAYNSQLISSDLIGVGWSLPIGIDYIYVDYQGSIYFEDANIYLMMDRQSIQLKLQTNIEQNILYYKLAQEVSDMEITIEYNKLQQIWILDTKKYQRIYGKANQSFANDCLRWSLNWPNWYGVGTRSTGLQPLIIAWYLNTHIDKQLKQTLFYDYEIDNDQFIGLSYTSAIHLKMIRSDHDDFKMIFNYGQKTYDEYTVSKPINDDGKIEFPVLLRQDRYLHGYQIMTIAYEQSILFGYQLKSNKRLLTEIEQRIYSETESIFKFHYKFILNSYALTKCKIPARGSSYEFDYDTLTLPSMKPNRNNVMSYPVNKENIKFAYGGNYTVMSYDNIHYIDIKILNRELTERVTSLQCPIFGKIDEFSIQTYQNVFVVLIVSDQSQQLYGFLRQDNKWYTDPILYEYDKNATILFSDSLIAVANSDQQTISLFDMSDKESSWQEPTVFNNLHITSIAVRKRIVIMYDDYNIWLFRYTNNWEQSILYTLPGQTAKTRATIYKFDIEKRIQNQYLNELTHNYFQIMNNVIILSTLRIINDRLICQTHLLTIDNQYKVSNTRTFTFQREYIFDMEFKLENEGTFYHFKYKQQNGKYRLHVNDVSGNALKELERQYRNRNLRKDAFDDYIVKLNDLDNFKKIFNTDSLINWSLYTINPVNEFIQYGTNEILRMTGTDWELTTIPNDYIINLGKRYHIITKNDDKINFKLYKDQKLIKEFKIYAQGKMINRYPIYLAYQSKPLTVNVLLFKDRNTLDTEHILHNEELIFDSDYQNLITKANITLKTRLEPYECLIRPITTLLSSRQQYIVNVSSLNYDEFQRQITYHHSSKFNSNKSIYTKNIIMIPNGDKRKYGWSETIYSRNIRTNQETKSQNWYDSNGNILNEPIEHHDEKQNQRDTKQNDESKYETFLLDYTNRWLISDFTPYITKDEMISYYGFESYELDQTIWKFNRNNVIKHLNAFTGENYLRITHDGSSIQGMFKPKNQDISYVSSCWLRSNISLNVNDLISNFKMTLRTTKGQEIITNFGHVKIQSNDWYYVELITDFRVMKDVYKDYLVYYNNNSMPSLGSVEFEIIFRIEANVDQAIDLDHIRFSPLTHDFEAFVYKPMIGTITATIHDNGIVTRTIYNHLNIKIATVNEDGTLAYFTSKSETGKLVPTPQGLQFNNQHPNHLIFIPESSSYETFNHGWKTDTPFAWRVSSPGQLTHNDPFPHRIQFENGSLNMNSFAVRLFIALEEINSYISLSIGNIGELKFIREQNIHTMILPNKDIISPLPCIGETIVMIEDDFLWIWFDGVLLVDQKLSKSKMRTNILTIEAQGQTVLEDLIIMKRPSLEIQYMNPFGEKDQIIKFEDSQTVLVHQVIYDTIGRKAITTKTTRIHRDNDNSPLLVYRSNFVNNINPKDPKSVWYTNRLHGEVDNLNPKDKGVAFIRTEYWDSPLNEDKIIGLPGPEFSTTGQCATWISRKSNIDFVGNLFPKEHGYQQKVQISSNGAETVSVYDQHNNKIALYVHVPGYNHLLSTYEYDNNNRLVKILSPLYHEKVDTAMKITVWQPNNITVKEQEWQRLLATQIVYNEYGQVIRKLTPDSEPIEYLYNQNGKMRFMVTSPRINNQTNQIIYFEYNELDQLIGTGYFNKSISIENLRQYTDSVYIPDTKKFQQIDYSYYHPDPHLRGRIKHCITYNDDGETVLEKLKYNTNEEIIERKTLNVIDEIENEVKYHYENGKIHVLTYSSIKGNHTLKLGYKYNRIGKLVELKLLDNPKIFYANFTYHASGELASEYLQSTNNSLTRKYSYNSPGFLEQITDPFMTEKLFYTGKGYGQAGYGDGIIIQTQFNVNWPNNSDPRWFQLTEDTLSTYTNYSIICLNALKQGGYLNGRNQSVKLYVIEAETKLPLVCPKRLLAKLIAQYQIPRIYGHRFSYGNHQELVMAKYYTYETENDINPLQLDSFSKLIPDINEKQSEEIWQLLTNAGYIIKNQQRYNPRTAIGKSGKTIFRNLDLKMDLANLKSDYILYMEPIKKFILNKFNKFISLNEFVESFLKWMGIETTSIMMYNWYKKIAQEIGEMLIKKEYFSIKSLDKYFIQLLNKYEKFIPKIVNVLSHHFAHELGENTFDHELMEIDANGNQQLFYTGYDRYRLTYLNHTNKIENIEKHSTFNYPFKHDVNGNVIQALHKGIENIQYHPITQRATQIHLVNGQTLQFYYDAMGERVLKKVYNANGQLSLETRYVRDTNGRVLMDEQKNYEGTTITEILTYYIYGLRGLIGIIRNDQFYYILNDHSGSVRLIIRAADNKVITAYDYMPYGELMRSFGGKINFMYRYTGQEWDEETGLYNYHARLYDPSIGRFYQPDPKAQYFSPYMYAGNSPISTIDPDGEFAFLIAFIVIGLVAGAYLGGAAANNRWNPFKWDWKDPGTYGGIFLGGLAGAFLPLTLGSSIAFFGGGLLGVTITSALALTGSYLMMAAANNNFNPKKWDWSSPKTYNGFFEGLGLLTGLFGGIRNVHKFGNSLAKSGFLTKNKFLILSYSTAVSIAYTHGVISNENKIAFWEWNWNNPGTYTALITGFDIGVGLWKDVKEIHHGFTKWRAQNALRISSSKRQLLKSILKNPKHPLYKVAGAVVIGYFQGSIINEDLDFTTWHFERYATYEGILQGMFLGRSSSTLLSNAKTSMTNSLKKLNIKNLIHRVLRKNMRFILNTILKDQKIFKSIHFIEQSFNKFDKKLIEHLPASVKQQIDKFYKLGLKKWKNGKSKIPKELERIFMKKAVKSIEGAKTFKKWNLDEEEIQRRQQEIYTDHDIEFLNCKSSRRRKRGAGKRGVNCLTSSTSTIQNEDENVNKLFNHLLEINDSGLPAGFSDTNTNNFKLIQPKSAIHPNGFSSEAPKDFAENFSLMLEHSPFMFEVNKRDFTMNLIAGSLFSSTSNLRGNINDIYIKTDTYSSHSLVKVVFKTVINGETHLVLKTFIIEPKPSIASRKPKTKFDHFNNIYDMDELKSIEKQLQITDDKYPIHEHILFVQYHNVLYGKDVSTTRDQYKYNTKFQGSKKTELKKIDAELNNDFEKQLSKIEQTTDIAEMETAVRDITNDLIKMYDKYSKTFELKATKTNPKPGITTFLYGALSSYLKNTFIYRIAGKGYSNIIFHIPKESWNDIPIIVDRSLRSTEASGKSMFYSLSINSLSKKGLLVNINTADSTINIQQVDIPQSKGFVTQISEPALPNAKDIEAELKYHYYNISKMASKIPEKKNDHYHRLLILGQLLAHPNINIYLHKTFNEHFSTFVFKDTIYQKWTQINMALGSKVTRSNYIFDDKGYNPPLTLPSTAKSNVKVTKIGIKFNSRSSIGWTVEEKLKKTDPEEPKRSVTSEFDKYYYYQGVKVSEDDISKFSDALSDYQYLKPVNIENLFDNDGNNPSMNTLKENLNFLKSFINKESDFQAVLHGLFLNNKKEATVIRDGYLYRVYAESNPAKSGRIDLLIQKLEITSTNQYREKELIVMELKYNDSGNAESMLTGADEQGQKYEANLLSFTNLDSFTLIPMVFDKQTGKILYKIRTKQPLRDVNPPDAITSSGKLPDPNPVDSNSGAKRPRTDTLDTDKKTDTSISTVIRKDRSINTNILINEQAFINSTIDVETNVVTSKGNRLEFWPINFVKKAGTAVLSMLPTSWTNENTKPNIEPTVLEMGDNLVKHTDVNGLLTWGVLLVNKWTGYRPKPMPQDNFDEMANTELNIRSTMIVNQFMDTLSKHLDQFKYHNIFENTITYFDAIKNVRQKLSTGKIENIPEMLFKLIVANNMDKTMANELKSKIDDMLELKDLIHKQEYEWLSHCSNQVPEFYNHHTQQDKFKNNSDVLADLSKTNFYMITHQNKIES